MSELVEMVAECRQLKMLVEFLVLIENYFWFIGGRDFSIIPQLLEEFLGLTTGFPSTRFKWRHLDYG